jgi:hypothetical protein
VAVGEEFQDFFVVIAESGKLDALLFESRKSGLQLDQLPFAEGSPIGGTEKEENGAVGTFECLKGLCVTKLIVRGKGGSFLADG